MGLASLTVSFSVAALLPVSAALSDPFGKHPLVSINTPKTTISAIISRKNVLSFIDYPSSHNFSDDEIFTIIHHP
jgi:hypothetical protein